MTANTTSGERRRQWGVALAVALFGLDPLPACGQCTVHVGALRSEQTSRLFGAAVALSQDGSIAVVGAYGEDANVGVAYVLSRTGDEWQQDARLIPADSVSAAGFGYAVSISDNGDTIAVGAVGDNETIGAVFIFVRSGTTWIQQGPKITPTGGIGQGGLGSAVSISSDGDTLIAGALYDNENTGAAYVFVRVAGVWSQHGPKLVPLSGPGRFGWSVAMSGDGQTALVGDWADAQFIGAVYVFARGVKQWERMGPRLVPVGGVGMGQFGRSVSLDLEGDTAAIGASGDDAGIGAAYIFVHDGGSWSQQGPKLVPTGGVGAGEFGASASISMGGDALIVGAESDNADLGAAYIFALSDGAWSQQGDKLIPVDNIGRGGFGYAAALSDDARVAIVGDYADDNYIGAAHAYELVPPSMIVEQPDDVRVVPGQRATFVAVVAPPEQAAYQWRKDGVALTDGGSIFGSSEAILVIEPASELDAGEYDLLVTDPCGQVVSDPAFLSVVCAADHNGNGVVNSQDFFHFLVDFFALDSLADVNADDVVNSQDFFDFLAAFFKGC